MDDSTVFLASALRPERFALSMRRHRSVRKLSMRRAAAQAGVPLATWARGEAAGNLTLENAAKIAAWIAGPEDRRGQTG